MIVAQRKEWTAKKNWSGSTKSGTRCEAEEGAYLSVCQGSGRAKECGANVDREGESVLEMKADHL